LVLDTQANSEEDLDDRLERLISWLEILDGQGTGWTLVIPAFDTTLTSREAPGGFLATLTPAPLPDRPVASSWPAMVTLLTGPGSRGAARLAQRLITTRRRFQPVETPPHTLQKQAPPPWWRRL
jgi:hypothetical protein